MLLSLVPSVLVFRYWQVCYGLQPIGCTTGLHAWSISQALSIVRPSYLILASVVTMWCHVPLTSSFLSSPLPPCPSPCPHPLWDVPSTSSCYPSELLPSSQLYLFGDAAIYCTFVPRSLVAFAFGDAPPPWAFDACLALFVLIIVPFWWAGRPCPVGPQTAP